MSPECKHGGVPLLRIRGVHNFPASRNCCNQLIDTVSRDIPAVDDVQHTLIFTSTIPVIVFRVTACVQYRECQICLALVPAQKLSEHMKDCCIR